MLKTVTQNPLVHLLVLSAAVWLIFARTLGSYFLADDFGEIYYVNTICNGDYGLIWLNFTSNFMSVPGMSVWRPWLLVSLLIDFIIWKANPIGFYLTNVLSFNAVVLLLYWFMRQLTKTSSVAKSSLVATLTALVFAVSPLHCESVSWVVGRVDVVCAVFYLLSLNFLKKSESAHYAGNRSLSKKLTAAAILFWWIAMWTKEMAIGAPVIALAMTFLFSQQAGNFKYAVRQSLPLWISTAVYFVLRYLALGTLLGGYTQGIGDSQAANALLHWLDPDTLRRLFFPFVYSLYGQNQTPAIALAACYTVTSTIIVLRAISFKINLKWLAFLFVWIATCLAPIYKLWGLGYELEGARFCFFLTMPLSAFVPVLLLLESREKRTKRNAGLDTNIAKSARTIGVTALVIATVVLGKTAFRTNLEWVHAGKEVREFLKQTSALNSDLLNKQQKIALLGIPKRHGGAHMILNSSTFRKGLLPPFTKADLSSQFYTFDPIYFSEKFRLDTSRFRTTTKKSNSIAFWDTEQRKLVQSNLLPAQTTLPILSIEPKGNDTNAAFIHTRGRASLIASSGNDGLTLGNIKEGDGIGFSQLHLNPLSADILEAEIAIIDSPPNLKEITVSASFDENDSLCQVITTAKLLGNSKKSFLIHLPLSQNWRWFTKGVIETLSLQMPPNTTTRIDSVRLIKTEQIKPILIAPTYQLSPDGHYMIPAHNDSLEFKVLMPKIDDVAKATIYITAKNSFFDTFEDAHKAVEHSFTLPINQIQPTLTIDAKRLNSDAFRQVSILLLDKDGKALGLESDPIIIRFEG